MKKVFFFVLTFICASIFIDVPQASAGTDITVECTTSVCSVTPINFSLFDELNMVPGYFATQKITAKNISEDTGIFGIIITNLETGGQREVSADLPSKIFVEIRQESTNGTLVYGGSGQTLKDMLAANLIQLGTIPAGQNEVYFFKATFDPNANNDYQSTTSTFDMDLGFEFLPAPTPQPTSSGSNGGGGGNGTSGGTSQASAPVCSDSAPSSAPTLISAVASGSQVTLNWSAASGADGYAINFGIQSGVYVYGSPNVGNVTSYVVTGLSPGVQYFFQVIPLHGCATGPRSNELSTAGTLLPPGSNINPPSGFSANQVLGIETDASKKDDNNPSVLGDTSACIPWKIYLPIVFLVLQVVLSSIIYSLFRNPENKLKQVGVVGVVVGTTLLFYFLRNCDCSQATIFALLCKWYVVVAAALGLVTQFVNYALIEKEQ